MCQHFERKPCFIDSNSPPCSLIAPQDEVKRAKNDYESGLSYLKITPASGGSIFAGLEHGAAEHAATFERVFGTPQDVDLVALAAAFGADARRVAAADSIDHTLYAGLGESGRAAVAALLAAGHYRLEQEEDEA